MRPLLHPLDIGGVELPNNLVLSPMAGFSDLPFRVLCRRHSAGLVCSEMVAASSVERRVARTLTRMRTVEEERPTSVQVFGTVPDEVERATVEVERHCDIIGFNMGCPAHQIKRQGCGAALLDHPDLAESLVAAMRSATRKPLLVKIRAGNGTKMDVVAFAKRMERAGASALIFHARTAAQGYSGKSDWALIREVKSHLGIPLIGNGDVVDGPSARAAFEASGVDGIALGRGALGDPRVFARIAHYLETGEELPLPTPVERFEDFVEYVGLAATLDLDAQHILQQAQQFTRGMPGGAKLRTKFQGGAPLSDVIDAFKAHVTRP